MPHGKRIAELLINIGAVKLSIDPPFTWASGLKAPIYCDNRMLYSHPEARDFVVNALVERIKAIHIEPDVIAGTATAAIGWAALVANKLDLPFVYVRSSVKGHGTQKLVEGDIPDGKHVILVEDLLSTGGSAIGSVTALREECKAIVTDVVAIFSYEMVVSTEKAQQAQVKLHPLSNLSILLDAAVELGRLTADDMNMAATFSKDPQNWSAQN